MSKLLPHINLLTVSLAAKIFQSRFFPRKNVRFSGGARDIAAQVLRTNSASGILVSGMGHFQTAMWTVDSALGLRGSKNILSRKLWSVWISRMINESAQKSFVPSCFTKNSSADAPWPRVDNLPALLFMADELHLVARYKPALTRLIAAYCQNYFQDDFIDTGRAGDWQDTIHRPSSAWAQLWGLCMLQIAEKHGLPTPIPASRFADKIIQAYWLPAGGFKNHSGHTDLGFDGSILALYLGLYPAKHSAIIRRLQAVGISRPYPVPAAPGDYLDTTPHLVPPLTRLTARNYHGTTVWPHLGAMYAVGLAKNGLLKEARQIHTKLSGIINHFGNVPESLTPQGHAYSHILTCEWGLTMGAGLFLEANQLMLYPSYSGLHLPTGGEKAD